MPLQESPALLEQAAPDHCSGVPVLSYFLPVWITIEPPPISVVALSS